MAPKSPAFPKADPATTAFFRDLVPDAPGVAVKPMFGHQAAFVDGTMFLGIFGDRVLVRLPPAERAELMAEPGSAPFDPMGGRPMKEYVLLPADWIDEPSLAAPWVQRGLTYARSLPKKPAKPKKRKPSP